MKYVINTIFAGVCLAITPYSVLAQTQDDDPAQVKIGERLFLETRFAQAYFKDTKAAEPALAFTLTMVDPLPGAFADKTMNCRSCHLVDEFRQTAQAGIRTYADFAHHSPIPDRQDKNHFTPRNSMSLVNIMLPGISDVTFHFDGEFNSMPDLVRATLTGRNYGWLADEDKIAAKHIARIIREDTGEDELAKEFGGAYKKILEGTAEDIPPQFRLPGEFHLKVEQASDQQILDVVARLISAYVESLQFAKDEKGNYSGSPYDQFLKLNKLPRQPHRGESFKTYSQRLLLAVNKLKSPRFVDSKQGKFTTHAQAFVFGPKELQGMKLFFNKGEGNRAGGNCVSCHSAPHFSDFRFHNTGLSQFNYDQLHGAGEFMKLAIPDLVSRNKNHDQYLPPTGMHPRANARFRAIADIDKPGYTDLGMWNIYANPDVNEPQAKLQKLLCDQAQAQTLKSCDAAALLPLAVATFKTPVLRDLGHAAPYMHNGQFNTLAEAVNFYITGSALFKMKQLRNPDPQLQHIQLKPTDVPALVAFLQSLNEDYE